MRIVEGKTSHIPCWYSLCGLWILCLLRLGLDHGKDSAVAVSAFGVERSTCTRGEGFTTYRAAQKIVTKKTPNRLSCSSIIVVEATPPVVVELDPLPILTTASSSVLTFDPSSSSSSSPASSLSASATATEVATTTTTTSRNKKKNDRDNEARFPFHSQQYQQQQQRQSNTQPSTSRLNVRLHGTWYDLQGWRNAHPAGAHWIDWYNGRDATEVMDGFHSDHGRAMYKRLPRSAAHVVAQLEAMVPPDTNTQRAFRTLRQQLQDDGFWQRDLQYEYTQLALWGLCVAVATCTAQVLPVVSMSFLATSMTAAGWLGHDYVHGVDAFANRLRNFAAIAAGLCPTWWSDKHNKHHALTNEQGVDEDIATNPFLYSWAPDPSDDSPLRKIQHLIFWIPFSFLFALWRYDSLVSAVNAIETKRPRAKQELYCLLIHYAILFTVFPVHVWLPAIFVSGLISALIVTPTHQSEAMFDTYQPDWVTAQFQSTRNAVTRNAFSEWIWGGMQYQLEHHLFPSMPRHQYPRLKSTLQQFAADQEIPGGYRESDEWDILYMNWQLYKTVAEAPAVVGAPLTQGTMHQQGAIRSTRK